MNRSWVPIRTRHDFEARVEIGVTCESQILEFKGGFEGYDTPTGLRELALDVSMFANTDGGSLLVGVMEKSVDGRAVADRIRATTGFDDRERRIRRAVRDWLIPSTLALEVIEVPVEGGPIVVVNVPPSERLVSVWDGQTSIQAVVRRGTNKHYLNPDEYEAHLMDGSRSKKLAFDRVFSALGADTNARVHLGRPVVVPDETSRGPVDRYLEALVFLVDAGDHEFKLKVASDHANYIVVVPYGLIREVWPHANEIGILLEPRLILWRDRIVFE